MSKKIKKKNKRTFVLPLVLLLTIELVLAITVQAFIVMKTLYGDIQDTQKKDYTFIAQSLADQIATELEGNEALLTGYTKNLHYELTARKGEEKDDWDTYCNLSLDNLKKSSPYFSSAFLLDDKGYVLFSTDSKIEGRNLSGMSYFKVLKKGSVSVYTNPTAISSTITGQTIIAHAASLKVNDKIKYIVGITMDIARYGDDHLLVNKLGESGYTYLLDSEGTLLVHPSDDLRYTSALKLDEIFNTLIVDKQAQLFGQYEEKGVTKRAVFVRLPQTGWYAGISMNNRESDSILIQMRLVFVIANSVLVFLTLFIVILFVRRNLLSRVRKLEQLINKASQGILSERGLVKGRDEISGMTEQINGLLDSLSHFFGGLDGDLGDLENTGNDLAANMEETAAALYQIRTNVENSLSQIEKQEASVSTTASTVEETAQNIVSLDRNIERQNENISQGSTAVEEMVAQIKNVSLATEEAESIMGYLALSSQSGRKNLEDMSTQVGEISEKSQELVEANSLISGIAARTNLLAMNAAIEAAHAGEAGRGFAVVADEIRKLAEQATKQSGQVKTTIDEIQNMVKGIVLGSRESNLSFEEIRNQVERMNNITGEIQASMEEQVAGGTQVLESLNDLKNAGMEVRIGSGEMTQGNKVILGAVQELTHISSEVAMAMQEIDRGMIEINRAMEAVSTLSMENKKSIAHVKGEAKQYKLD